jgi:hypothetical protein
LGKEENYSPDWLHLKNAKLNNKYQKYRKTEKLKDRKIARQKDRKIER